MACGETYVEHPLVKRAPKARVVHPLIENKFWLFTLSYVMLSVVEESPGRVPCEMGAEVRKFMYGVLAMYCHTRRPSDEKSKHLHVLVVRFSRFAVCQMLAYSTSSTVSLAFGKNHHNKQAQMCSQLWGWRCSTRRR